MDVVSVLGSLPIEICRATLTACGIILTGHRYNDFYDWIDLEDILMELVQAESPVIQSVPRTLRVENEEAYTPRVVCIGLLHRGKSSLEEMEKEKELIYMSSLFQRTGKDHAEQTKVGCVAALRKMENTLRRCYPAAVAPDELDVVSAVLVDSCFIIELLYRHYTEQYDPILQEALKKFEVQRDLLLLENQIPFSALEEVFKLTVNRFHGPLSLGRCVVSFFGDIMGTGDKWLAERWEVQPNAPLHILHLLHNCYNPCYYASRRPVRIVRRDAQVDPCGYKPTATQLKDAGVHLTKCEMKLFYLRFRTPYLFPWKSGKLEIPRFSVSQITEPFLRNLMAFEHFTPWVGTIFTSHAFLMDILIDSVEDVQLLEEARIINNSLGSRDSVVKIFNGISKYVEPRHFYYNKLCNTMEHFCTPWQAQMETVRRNCAGNLWIRLTVFAATLIFVLTLLQTIYTIISYHHPHK